MSDEESEHVAFWERAEQADGLGAIPGILEDTDTAVEDLEKVLSESRAMLHGMEARCDVARAFLIAYRMEFYLLHPAFVTLFQVLRPSAGEPDPADEYESHIEEFIEMLATHGAVTPELELLGDTIRRLWHENRRLVGQSTSDDLTGVLNRRGLFAFATQLAHIAARSGMPLGVLVIDVDHFKQVNDSHGHLTGDRVLRAIADVLASRLRASDAVGRWGGEEFAVVASPMVAGGMATLAEDLRQAVERAVPEGISVTVSIGAVESPIRQDDPREELLRLLALADAALYRAKERGRNRIELA